MDRMEDHLTEFDKGIVEACGSWLDRKGIGSSILSFYLHEAEGQFNPYTFGDWLRNISTSKDIKMLDEPKALDALYESHLSAGDSVRCRRTEKGEIQWLYHVGGNDDRIGNAWVRFGVLS